MSNNQLIFGIDPKITIKEVNENLSQSILNEVDSTFTGYKIKYATKLLEDLLDNKEVKEKIQRDTSNYLQRNQTKEILGSKVQEAAVYTVYDFSECNHSEYSELVEIENYIKNRKKEIEKELTDFCKSLEKQDGKLFNQGSLKIETTPTKSIIKEFDHKLVTIANKSDIDEVEAPKKIQKMGLKYFIK